MDRTLDWRPSHDERSRSFPVAALLDDTPPRRNRRWRGPAERVDQGAEGACVGFAWAIELMAAPVSIRLPTPDTFARALYREAQKVDEWPGENYDGTSVLAGAKVVQRLGFIGSYWWAFTIDEVVDAVLRLGPVVVGIPWYSTMYDTRRDGLVEVDGHMVGGHAICLTGVMRRGFGWPRRGRDVVRWRNSWGATYGLRGDGYIPVEDLERLLADRGEACVPSMRTWGA